ncbi:polysaccharide biosynthesis C-terminal domain-containing protein, partial [Bacillus sp. JJ1122]
IVAAVINIILNFTLIPKFGYVGATIATLIAYFIMFLMHYFVTRALLRHKDFPSIYLIVSIISIVVSNILIYLNFDLFIVRLCIGITFLFCYLGYLFLNKREILLL